MRICGVNWCARNGWTHTKFPRRGRLKLTLLYMFEIETHQTRQHSSSLQLSNFGLCFVISQTVEEMTQVVGGSITFSNPTKQGASLLYNGGTIAVVVKGNMDSSYIDSFKDRIQWDQQTGQFTIRELKTSDSGIYVVDGKGGVKTTYQLTVYDPVSRPMLTTLFNGSCSVECSVMNDRDVTLSWYSGEKILNQTSSPELSIKLSLPLEVDKQDRTSYRCEAANPVTKENVTFHVPTSCPETGPGPYKERGYWSLMAVMCVLIASVVIGIAVCQKKGRTGHSQDTSEREHADIQYAEISHIIPTSIQDGRADISELDPPRETELTSVYDKIQFHRIVDSGDFKTA